MSGYFKGKKQTQKMLMLMHSVSRNENVTPQKVLAPLNWYVLLHTGKIGRNLARENSFRHLCTKTSEQVLHVIYIQHQKICCVQVSLSVIQFKMWQKYIETNRTVVNRFINYVQKYNSKHQLLVFFYKLKKTNLLYSSYLKKKK